MRAEAEPKPRRRRNESGLIRFERTSLTLGGSEAVKEFELWQGFHFVSVTGSGFVCRVGHSLHQPVRASVGWLAILIAVP
jgi:hypothetical protein